MGRKKGGGGKLNRSEIIQARLDPKLHMAAEILARSQRRTLSSLIEVLIESAAEKTKIPATVSGAAQINAIQLNRKKREMRSVSDLIDLLWSSEESDRFVMMALLLPDLLTAEEEYLWRLIKSTSYFWSYFPINIETNSGEIIGQGAWPLYNEEGLVREHLHEQWPLLKDILEGKKTESDLRKLNLSRGKLIDKPKDYPFEVKTIGRKDGD